MGFSCAPLDEVDCELAPEPMNVDLAAGQTTYFVLDSFQDTGGAIVEIAQNQP